MEILGVSGSLLRGNQHEEMIFSPLVWCLKNRYNYFDRCWSKQLAYRRLR